MMTDAECWQHKQLGRCPNAGPYMAAVSGLSTSTGAIRPPNSAPF